MRYCDAKQLYYSLSSFKRAYISCHRNQIPKQSSPQSSDQGGDESSSLEDNESEDESESVYCDDVASKEESSEEVTPDQ